MKLRQINLPAYLGGDLYLEATPRKIRQVDS